MPGSIFQETGAGILLEDGSPLRLEDAVSWLARVTADGATGVWRLRDTSGTTAVADVGSNGTYNGTAYTQGQPNGLTDGDTSVLFNAGASIGSVTVAGTPVPAGTSAQTY